MPTSTLIERLTALSTLPHDYTRNPEPEITTVYAQYIASGQYPYLAKIDEAVKAIYPIPETLNDTLHTQSYLASQRYQEQTTRSVEAKLEADGWTKITLQNWNQIPMAGNAELRLDNTSDMFGGIHTLKCRIKENKTAKGGSHAFFLPPKSKTKGYDAYNLALIDGNAFYRMTA